MTIDNTPYSKSFVDVTIAGDFKDVGVVKMAIRKTTAHCYFWINNKYLGRSFSLNQFTDDFTYTYEDKTIITIRGKWLPIWKISVYKNNEFCGEHYYLLGTFIYYISNALSLLLIFLVIWWISK
ncbi:hypothetical protein LBMAG53_27560 [Planctomycetota bacterium]|nr:hypothetical protein LBMAG53_27560 [Planctomycetota bacterium]